MNFGRNQEMTLAELKNQITTNAPIADEFYIFLCSENTYLADQYVRAICEAKGLAYISSESIFEQLSAVSLVMPSENNFRVIRVDEFNEVAEDYSIFTNTAIICYKIDKKLESLLKDYIITVPKLEEWHIKAYIKDKCSALTDNEISWLYNVTGGDIYRLDNELDKISLFDESSKYSIFRLISNDPKSDLYRFSNFDFAKAIVRNDAGTVAEVLAHRHCFKIDFYNLIGIMLGQVRDTLLATRNSGRDPETELKITRNRIWHLNNDFGQVSTARLQKLLKELSALDLQVKSGLLDTSNEAQLDYIITRLMG
jgi:DNA polymerase III delta subunit